MLFENTQLKTELFNALYSSFKSVEIDQKPSLVIGNFNDNLASSKYVEMKMATGNKLGVNVKTYDYTQLNLLLQEPRSKSSATNGLIIQLPVTNSLQKQILTTREFWLDNFGPKYFDLDFLTPFNQSELWDKGLLPPTIQAIDYVLKNIIWKLQFESNLYENKLNLIGKTLAIIGQGELVGKFMARYCIDRCATLISINKDTNNPESLTSIADVVICASGVPDLVDSSWLKPGAIIIDAGTSEVSGVLKGDLADSLIQNHDDQYFICKSPGGIGPITVLCIFENLLKMYNLQKNRFTV